jgi:hypothetical protein
MLGRDDELLALGGYLSVDASALTPLALALARRFTGSSHNQQRMLCASSRGDTPRAADTNVRAALYSAATEIPCLRRGCAGEKAFRRCEPARITYRKTPPSTQAALSSDVHDVNHRYC